MTIRELIVALQAQADEYDDRNKVFLMGGDGQLLPIVGVHTENENADVNPKTVVES